jgi:hypothetical protein
MFSSLLFFTSCRLHLNGKVPAEAAAFLVQKIRNVILLSLIAFFAARP